MEMSIRIVGHENGVIPSQEKTLKIYVAYIRRHRIRLVMLIQIKNRIMHSLQHAVYERALLMSENTSIIISCIIGTFE